MEDASQKVYKKSTIIGKNTEKSADKSNHYVDRPAFFEAMVERKRIIAETGIPPRVSEFIGKCLLDIATGLSKKYQFIGYSFRDEMVSDAVIHCLNYIDSFNPSVSNNPFSYFSQTCYFVFIERIKAEKKQQYVKYVTMLDSAALQEVADQPDQYSHHDINMSDLDTTHIAEFVQKYQQGIDAKATKTRTKKGPTMKTLDDYEQKQSDTNQELNEYVAEEIVGEPLIDFIEPFVDEDDFDK